MFASPDGFEGVDAKIATFVFLVVTLNKFTAPPLAGEVVPAKLGKQIGMIRKLYRQPIRIHQRQLISMWLLHADQRFLYAFDDC